MMEMATHRDRHEVPRGLLDDRRREIQAELRSLREALPDEVAEVKDAEEHGLDDVMREVDFVLLQMKSETLRQIDEAIGRLESSTYGVCDECGREIAEGRLQALPFVRLCRACQEDEESREAAERAARLRGPLLEELVTGASVRDESVWSRPRGAESRMRQSRRVGVRATATAGLSQGEAR